MSRQRPSSKRERRSGVKEVALFSTAPQIAAPFRLDSASLSPVPLHHDDSTAKPDSWRFELTAPATARHILQLQPQLQIQPQLQLQLQARYCLRSVGRGGRCREGAANAAKKSQTLSTHAQLHTQTRYRRLHLRVREDRSGHPYRAKASSARGSRRRVLRGHRGHLHCHRRHGHGHGRGRGRKTAEAAGRWGSDN